MTTIGWRGAASSLTLISAIDDATGEIPVALFRPEEDAAGYFLLLEAISQHHGLPLALYADPRLHRAPRRPASSSSWPENAPGPSLGGLLDELGIHLIPSYSPQGRGRVECLFGTLQDRLVKELRRARACTLAEANAALEAFLPGFTILAQGNTRFGQEPADPQAAFLPWPADLAGDDVFCFKHQRTVRKDNTISLAGHVLPIPADRQRTHYARCRVEVRQHMDGRLSLWYQGQRLAVHQPEMADPPRVGQFTLDRLPAKDRPQRRKAQAEPEKPKSGQPWKPPADHPWRSPYKIAAKPTIKTR